MATACRRRHISGVAQLWLCGVLSQQPRQYAVPHLVQVASISDSLGSIGGRTSSSASCGGEEGSRGCRTNQLAEQKPKRTRAYMTINHSQWIPRPTLAAEPHLLSREIRQCPQNKLTNTRIPMRIRRRVYFTSKPRLNRACQPRTLWTRRARRRHNGINVDGRNSMPGRWV